MRIKSNDFENYVNFCKKTDSIVLTIGSELQKLNLHRIKQQTYIKDIYYFRPNNMLASINKKTKDIDFISGTGYSKKYDIKNLSGQVMKYLGTLG